MNNLVEFRKKHGLTQKQTWEILGRSRATIQRWEKTDSVPDYVIFGLESILKKEDKNDT